MIWAGTEFQSDAPEKEKRELAHLSDIGRALLIETRTCARGEAIDIEGGGGCGGGKLTADDRAPAAVAPDEPRGQHVTRVLNSTLRRAGTAWYQRFFHSLLCTQT